MIGLSFSVFVAGIFIWNFLSPADSEVDYEVQPIVRDTSQAWYPVSSKNGEFLAYIERQQNVNSLVLKNVATGQSIRLSKEGTRLRSSAICTDGSRLSVVTENEHERCAVMMLTPDWLMMTFRQESWLSECAFQTVDKLSFSPDQQSLWLIHGDGSGSRQLFRLDKTNGLVPLQLSPGKKQKVLTPTFLTSQIMVNLFCNCERSPQS